MMDWLWTFLVYTLDWKLQAIILAGVVGVPVLLIAAAFFGWPATIRYVLAPLLAVIAVLSVGSKIRQSGYADRRAEEEKAQDEASDFADDLRGDVKKLPKDQLDDRFNRWEK